MALIKSADSVEKEGSANIAQVLINETPIMDELLAMLDKFKEMTQ